MPTYSRNGGVWNPALQRRWRLLQWVVVVLILKVNAGIVWNYGSYFPPDFQSEFLRGREAYFEGSYQWGFWGHILAGPLTLILGLLLISTRFRQRFAALHRVLGRVQAVLVLGMLVPGGIYMACYAAAGPVAGIGLGLLGVLTGLTIICGVRSAMQRNFESHRQWMLRNYTLLCSAVVLRMIAGAATVFAYGPDWFDPVAVWLCWLIPSAILEGYLSMHRRNVFSFRIASMPQETPRLIGTLAK